MSQADQNDYNIVEFAEGFVHGLQKYENQTSKCSTDIMKLQSIVDDLVKIWNDVSSGKLNPADIIAFAYKAFSTLTTIENSCHFYELVASIISLFNPIALVFRILVLIFIDSWTIIPSFFRFLWGLAFGNFYSAGLNLGRIIKLALNYEIEL